MAGLVTPLQYVALEIYTPGLEPIVLEHPFSQPVPAGNSRDEEISFIVPASLSLDRSSLRIRFYSEQKDMPLSSITHSASAAEMATR
jgi:hypothetical protein